MKKNMTLIFPIFLITTFQVIFCISRVFGEAEKIIHMGIIADTISGMDVNDAVIAVETIINKLLSRKLPEYKCKSTLYFDADAAINEYLANKVDVLHLTSLNYIKNKDKLNIIPAFVPLNGGKPLNTYVMLVRKESGLNTLERMKSKTLIVEAGNSGDIALLWLDTILLEKFLKESRSFFRNIKRVNKVSQAVLPVFFKQADVCIVRRFTFETMVDLNPQIAQNLMILRESQPFLFSIGALHPGIDKRAAEIIKKFSKMLIEEPEGRQLLLLYGIEEVVDYKPEYLENIMNLYNRNLILNQKKKKRFSDDGRQ